MTPIQPENPLDNAYMETENTDKKMAIDKHEELTEYGVYLKKQKNKSVAAIESELRRLSDASLTVVDKMEIKRILINVLTEFEFKH